MRFPMIGEPGAEKQLPEDCQLLTTAHLLLKQHGQEMCLRNGPGLRLLPGKLGLPLSPASITPVSSAIRKVLLPPKRAERITRETSHCVYEPFGLRFKLTLPICGLEWRAASL